MSGRHLEIRYTVQMGEAEAMCLDRERALVPVRSRIYNAYMIDDIGFILMEKIPGVNLEACRINLNQNTSRIPEYACNAAPRSQNSASKLFNWTAYSPNKRMLQNKFRHYICQESCIGM